MIVKMNTLSKEDLEEKTIYTADDEEPDCMRCDHCCDSYEICEKCGAEYWWAKYRRTEIDKELDKGDNTNG